MIFYLNAWYDKAVQKSDSILSAYSKDLFAWWYKGLSRMAQRKYQEARDSFNQVVLIAPDSLSGHMGLGQAYSQINDYQKALEAFGRVIEIDPSYAPAYMACGDVYLQTNQEENAIEAYRKVVTLIPKSADAYQRLAYVLSEKPNGYEEALKFATKAIQLAPQHPFSLDVLGWVHVQRGEVKKGIEELKQASSLLPRDPNILYHLGVGYYKDGNPAEAKRILEAALNISKNFKGADQATEILKKLR